MIELKNNYQDDVLDSEKNQLRKYNMIQNDDGTVSFVDATVYSQNGDNFGAKDINDIVARIGEVSKAENIAYDGDKSVQGAIDECVRTLGYTVTSKNLLPYPYYNTTLQANSVHFTDNGDGTVTINGTATGDAIFQLKHREYDYLTLKVDTYTVTGVPKNSNGVQIRVLNSDGEIIATDEGNGANLAINETENIGSYIFVASGTTVNNLVIKPMISKEGGEYEPYVPSVKSLICDVEKVSIKDTMEFEAIKSNIIYRYTATKRCEVNLTFFVHGENAAIIPSFMQTYVNGEIVAYDRQLQASGCHAMTQALNVILEPNEIIVCYVEFFQAGNNGIVVNGFIRHLE